MVGDRLVLGVGEGDVFVDGVAGGLELREEAPDCVLSASQAFEDGEVGGVFEAEGAFAFLDGILDVLGGSEGGAGEDVSESFFSVRLCLF